MFHSSWLLGYSKGVLTKSCLWTTWQFWRIVAETGPYNDFLRLPATLQAQAASKNRLNWLLSRAVFLRSRFCKLANLAESFQSVATTDRSLLRLFNSSEKASWKDEVNESSITYPNVFHLIYCTVHTVELRYSQVVGRPENLDSIKALLLYWRCYVVKNHFS